MPTKVPDRGPGRPLTPPPPEWSKFRLDAEVLAGLDRIAAWLEAEGHRQPRRGPKGASRADALRYAVEMTLQQLAVRPREEAPAAPAAAKPTSTGKRPGRGRKAT